VSVHKRGDGYRVRWRDASGKAHSQQVDSYTDAVALDTDRRRKKQLGHDLTRDLDRSGVTLAGFLAEGFKSYAATLSPKTRECYAWAYDNHFGDLLDEPLAAIDVGRLMDHQAQLLASGRTANTVREVMLKLSGILTAAVERGLIPANPVRGMRRVPADPSEDVNPLSPVDLERIVARFDGRSRVMLLLAGHLGLRPLEVRKARVSDFRGSTLTVSRARTKSTAARTRVIDVPATTAREIKAWLLQSGYRGDDLLVGPISPESMGRWWRREIAPVVAEITGRDDVTLYTLRHTHASALHYCGWTVPDAAERMGHTQVIHLETYAHPIKVIGSQRWRDVDALIRESRGKAPKRTRKAAAR